MTKDMIECYVTIRANCLGNVICRMAYLTLKLLGGGQVAPHLSTQKTKKYGIVEYVNFLYYMS